MRRMRKPEKPLSAQIDPITLFDPEKRGAEKKVQRAELYYPEYGKKVDGLVFVTPHYTERRFVETFVNNAIRQWRLLKEINQRRKNNDQTTLLLPPTVRAYEDDKRLGLLMTDLSDNGANPLIDVKDLQSTDITQAEWENIKSQIIRDVEIAREEHLLLGGGPSDLDSWSCTYDLTQRSYIVYLVDIGFLTRVGAPIDMVETRADRIVRALNKKEAELFSAQ